MLLEMLVCQGGNVRRKKRTKDKTLKNIKEKNKERTPPKRIHSEEFKIEFIQPT